MRLGAGLGAFVTGMDGMLWVCGGIALGGAVLAVIFLPRRADGSAARDSALVASGDSGAERAELEA